MVTAWGMLPARGHDKLLWVWQCSIARSSPQCIATQLHYNHAKTGITKWPSCHGRAEYHKHADHYTAWCGHSKTRAVNPISREHCNKRPAVFRDWLRISATIPWLVNTHTHIDLCSTTQTDWPPTNNGFLCIVRDGHWSALTSGSTLPVLLLVPRVDHSNPPPPPPPPRVCNSAYGVSDGENSHHVSQIRSYHVQTKDSVYTIRISAMIMLGICIPTVSFCQRVLFLLLRCSLKTGWKRTTGTLHHVSFRHRRTP